MTNLNDLNPKHPSEITRCEQCGTPLDITDVFELDDEFVCFRCYSKRIDEETLNSCR